MKLRLPSPRFPQIARATAVGYVLSALGLLSGAFGVVRWLAAFAGVPLSATTLAVSLSVGLLFSGAGFSLLVVGSDPFEEDAWVACQSNDDMRSGSLPDQHDEEEPPVAA